MIAGLLFAIAEAEDRPGQLVATLPFGGATLIEHQARALVAAGAAQLVVAVARVTPELSGALNRIGRRGVTVDPVRSAGDALTKLHPLARVVTLADGLVATPAALDAIVEGPGEAVATARDEGAAAGGERLGGGLVWAGLARIDSERLREQTRMPQDYDLQSSLLRLAEQAGAIHVALPDAALAQGHGIEHRAGGLASRSRSVLAAIAAARRGWFDRWVMGPVARVALPRLVERHVGGSVLLGVGAAAALLGLGLLVAGWCATGVLAVVAACLVWDSGIALGELRDEGRIVALQRLALAIVPAVALLALGAIASGADRAPLALAVAGIVAGAITERAVQERRRQAWWATPPALLVAAAVPTVLGWPTLGLTLAAGYAAATLAAAVEGLRRQP